jgi:hypothetical protein
VTKKAHEVFRARGHATDSLQGPGRRRLIVGVLSSVTLVCLASYSALWPPVSAIVERFGAVVLLFVVLSLVTFPISIGVFPWFYAIKWTISEKSITFWVPGRLGGLRREVVNEKWTSLTPSAFGVLARRADGTKLCVPACLRAESDDARWVPQLVEDKIVYRLRE